MSGLQRSLERHSTVQYGPRATMHSWQAVAGSRVAALQTSACVSSVLEM